MLKHFAVISFPRCGTTMLTRMINVEKQYMEVLNPVLDVDNTMFTTDPGVHRTEYSESDLVLRINQRFQKYLEDRKKYTSTSVKKFFYDVGTIDFRQDTHIICLRRHNPYHIFLSLQIATHSGIYGIEGGEEEQLDIADSFEVTRKVYEDFVAGYIGYQHKVKQQYRGYRFSEVWYEDIINIHEETILDGIPLLPVHRSNQVKRNSRLLYGRVTNIKEVRSWFEADKEMWKDNEQRMQ